MNKTTNETEIQTPERKRKPDWLRVKLPTGPEYAKVRKLVDEHKLHTICESGSIYAGVPAKKIKDISPELVQGEIERIANNYVQYADWFKDLPATQ